MRSRSVTFVQAGQVQLTACAIPRRRPRKAKVTLLDRVEEHGRIKLAVECVAEGRVSFDLVDMDHRIEPLDHGPGDIRDDVLGVLERAPDHIVGVAGDVGHKQDSALDPGRHDVRPP